MKNLFIILICIFAGASAGLFTRPTFILIGQLNWLDVLSKGYYVGSIPKFFTQGMLDESFYWVLKFMAAGAGLGVLITLISGSGSKTKSKSKK